MSEIPKAYEPHSVEDKWYRFWLDHSCFTADPARVSATRPTYSIVIPPPNVTGVLTMGHVLNNTIQDILARKARMDGKEVLWLPGTDHAGIATQTAVERALKKSGEIKHRNDLGREKFLEKVWEWKDKHGGIILQQLKALGASCDWARTRFTMDPEYSRCVQKVFVDLYKKGLIYRGKRMVNWCPASLTALSDEEVIMKEQKGALYYFRVEVAESSSGSSRGNEAQTSPKVSGSDQSLLTSAATKEGEEKKAFGPVTDAEGRIWLTIATTRPETIPGDTAVAVNPKDPRYAHLIGKHIARPLPAELPSEQKLIPIIGDEHVDFEFGTGVLKVTPAHDKADFEIGQRHKLPVVEVIEADGKMNALAGQDLKGLDRFAARKLAVEKLTELGALEKQEPYTNNVGYSERADVPIEPRLSEQWFLKYPSVDASKKCVASGEMRFFPDRWAKVYDHWMTGIQDWCISRQLWWGHRIPVWSRMVDEAGSDSLPTNVREFLRIPSSKLTFDAVSAEPHPSGYRNVIIASLTKTRGAETCFRTVSTDKLDSWRLEALTSNANESKILEQSGFTQDPDVLDTWFSSWLWPFATMGWTGDKETDANNPTLKAFYPTTDLVTGPDIIFFWVARMIMAGYEYMGDLPFRNVYFTGIIRDKQGRKMSKSLGNSPDPLDLIAKYGADALRFGVMRAAPLGQDILFDEQNVELGRNFCNKLWNACRFRQMQGGEVQGEINASLLRSDDKWILIKLGQAIREITDALANYRFNEATQALYRFFWSEYCDWYVEASKAVLSSGSRGNEAQTEKSAIRNPQSEMDESLLTLAATNLEAHRASKLAVMDFVLSHTLRLFHPFLPFITEELWHGMGYHLDMPTEQGGQTIMNAPWPKQFDADFRDHYSLDDCYLEAVNAKYEAVTRGRNLRREANIPAGKRVKFVLKPSKVISANDVEVLKLLLNAEELETNPDYQPPKGTPVVHTDLGELYLPLEGLVDVAAEIARLTKEQEKVQGEIVKVEQKLANPSFTQKAPPQVLQEHQQRLAEWQAKLATVKAALEALGS